MLVIVLTIRKGIDHLCDEYGQVLKFSQGRVIDIGFIGGRGKLLKFVHELEDRQIITGESFITVGETVYDWNNISQTMNKLLDCRRYINFMRRVMNLAVTNYELID